MKYLILGLTSLVLLSGIIYFYQSKRSTSVIKTSKQESAVTMPGDGDTAAKPNDADNSQANSADSDDSDLISSHTDYDYQSEDFTQQYNLEQLPKIQVDLSFLKKLAERYYRLSKNVIIDNQSTNGSPDTQLTRLLISFPNYENPDVPPTIDYYFYSPQANTQYKIRWQSTQKPAITEKKINFSATPIICH